MEKKHKRYREKASSSSSNESPVSKIPKNMEKGITLEALEKMLDRKLEPIKEKLDLMDAIVRENIELKITQQKQAQKIEDLENEIDKLSMYNKRHNLIFRNVPVAPGDILEDKIREIINKTLKISEDPGIQRVYSIRKMENKANILAEFRNINVIFSILSKSNLLKEKGIIVTKDLPINIVRKESKLLAIRKKLKEKNFRKTVKVKSGCMIIEDLRLQWNNSCGLVCVNGEDGVEKLKAVYAIDVGEKVKSLLDETAGTSGLKNIRPQ